jgi:hypothetical protein
MRCAACETALANGFEDWAPKCPADAAFTTMKSSELYFGGVIRGDILVH